MITSTLQV